MSKYALGPALVGLGLLIAVLAPGLPTQLRSWAGLAIPAVPVSVPAPDDHGRAHGHEHGEGGKEGPEGHVIMAAEQIDAAAIKVEPVTPGTIVRRLAVPGLVQPDPDRIARVAAKVVGTVAEMRKRLGDRVERGEIVALLDSREVADAKSEFFAARVNLDLQTTLFEREQTLWDKRISAEQQFLRARQAFTEAHLRVELAAQKLQALGLTGEDIDILARRSTAVRTSSAGSAAPVPASGMQRYPLRSPISGRVVERLVDVGAPVGGESEAKELYVLADLSSVWVELSVPVGDLPAIKEDQAVSIFHGSGPASAGRIVFVSPMLNQDTRSARVVASVGNTDLAWRPGTYVTAEVTVSEEPADMRVPRTALQTIGGEQVVFVRNGKGFEKREVAVGKGDAEAVEIVFGLDPGESVAVANSFVLKAELGKAEAEHSH